MEKYERHLRYTKISFFHKNGHLFLIIAKKNFRVHSTENPAPVEKMYSLLSTFLSFRVSIFTDHFCFMPAFPIYVLMETENLYDVALMSPIVLSYTSDEEKKNQGGMLSDWLGSVFDTSRDCLRGSFENFKRLTTEGPKAMNEIALQLTFHSTVSSSPVSTGYIAGYHSRSGIRSDTPMEAAAHPPFLD